MNLSRLLIASVGFSLALASPPFAASNQSAYIDAGSPDPIILEGIAPYYVPPVAIVPTTSPVTWVNPTASPHSIRHDGCVTFGPCAFDSGAVKPDGRFTVPVLPPGTYPYHCELHPVMRGTLIIVAPQSTSGEVASIAKEPE